MSINNKKMKTPSKKEFEEFYARLVEAEAKKKASIKAMEEEMQKDLPFILQARQHIREIMAMEEISVSIFAYPE